MTVPKNKTLGGIISSAPAHKQPPPHVAAWLRERAVSSTHCQGSYRSVFAGFIWFWHISLLSYPHRFRRSECPVSWNKGTSIQKKQEELLLQFCEEMKDQRKFEACSIPSSFSSSFTTHSLKMQTHAASLTSFHRWHDIKLTEQWLFDIQADNTAALLSNTQTIGKKCGSHKWVNLQLAVQEINKPLPTKHSFSLKYVTCH